MWERESERLILEEVSEREYGERCVPNDIKD